MTSLIQPFTSQVPGRVFLFGEHSDYLSLEVISLAINRFLTISVTPTNSNVVSITYSDLKQKDSFSINQFPSYRSSRDYLRSAFTVLKREGISPSVGASLIVKGTIPIAAGLSSSSALSLAAIQAFSTLAGYQLSRDKLIQFAFQSEVREFNESGGMMDHIASCYGGIVHVAFDRPVDPTPLDISLNGLIIGNSLTQKTDTVGDLKKIRSVAEEGYNYLQQRIEGFHQNKTPLSVVEKHLAGLSEQCQRMTLATIKNRNLTKHALIELQKERIDPSLIGKMFNDQHRLLRDDLNRSTPKIEMMIEAAKKAGALGCKINGSGWGGTILAYAPGTEQKIIQALVEAGGEAFIVKSAPGARIIPIS
jgi:galactokinase